MKRVLYLVAGLAAGAFAYGAANYHVIVMDGKLKLLKKTRMSFNNTLVDARGLRRTTLYLNPEIAKAGVKNLFKDESITIGK